MDASNSYWILYRDPAAHVRTLAETDRRDQAVAILEIAVLTPGIELIDYSYNLDGAIDELLWTGQPPIERPVPEPVAV